MATTFAHLLKTYMARTGISDTELARSIGVRRQTVFRWKEGIVARPRNREDVLACARRLRLTQAETDALLMAAGFGPQAAPDLPASAPPDDPDADSSLPLDASLPVDASLPDSAQTVLDVDPRPPRRVDLRWIGGLLLSVLVLSVIGVAVGGWLWTTFRADPPVDYPVDYPVAESGETLVLVGAFNNYAGEGGFNVAGRVQETLAQVLADASLSTARAARWPDTVADESTAQAILAQADAALLIWGEYDSGRVLVRLTLPELADSPSGGKRMETLVATPADLSATINTDVPQEVRYVALVTLGQLYLGRGDVAKARAALAQALSAPPEETDAQALLYHRLAYAYQIGPDPDLDQTIAYYDQVVDLQPGWKTTFFNRGLAHYARGETGDYFQAVADFSQALRMDRTYAQALVGRGVVYLSRRDPGDLDRAAQDFDAALALNPALYQAAYNRGLIALRRDDAAAWQTDLAATVALAPDFADAYAALCWGHVLDQQPETALPHCDRAIDLGADVALDSRGMAYAQLGRFADAAVDLRGFLDWVEAQPANSPYRLYQQPVSAWLAQVEAGVNPFTPDVLERLRQE
jgi:tetratricopeptide (TPR) repeat protein/DNA-binding XRE family transcriptional regulator